MKGLMGVTGLLPFYCGLCIPRQHKNHSSVERNKVGNARGGDTPMALMYFLQGHSAW